MNIAFIFAHPDDESLSTGGTITKYINLGKNVSTVCLSSSKVRKNEYFKATDKLGVDKKIIYDYSDVVNYKNELKNKLIHFILEFRPNIVVTHIQNDYHIDHRVTFEIVLEAIEWAAHVTQHDNAHLVSKLYTTETTILLPNPHILVDISDYFDIKQEAIKQYKSQLYKGGTNFYLDFHKYRNLMRGAQAAVKYAEAFLQISLKQNSPFYKKRHSEL